MSFHSHIEQLRNKLSIDKYKNEIIHLTQLEVTEDEELNNSIKQRITLLKKNISSLHELSMQNECCENMFDDIDKYMYRQPWKNINYDNKMVKIRTYLETLITDKENCADVLESIKKIGKRKLSSNKCILYDPNLESITSIPCIARNEESNKYELIKI